MTMPMAGGGRGNGLSPPLILIIVALFVLMAFETAQEVRNRSALTDLMQAQQSSVDQGMKLRRQLQNLAGKTAELAAAGDAGAKSVIDQMKAQGVTLSAPKK